jgi:hypothetical protein
LLVQQNRRKDPDRKAGTSGAENKGHELGVPHLIDTYGDRALSRTDPCFGEAHGVCLSTLRANTAGATAGSL